MMKTKAFFTIIAASALSFNSAAFDLSNAYNLALVNDIQFQIETSNLMAAEAIIPQAQSAFKPKLSAQAKGSYTDRRESSSSLFSNSSINGRLIYSQVIYNQQSSADTDAAHAKFEQAKLSLKTAQEDLIIRTAEAYFNILSAQDNLEFALIEKKAIARQLEQAEKRFEVGLTAITDVKEAQAKFDTSVAQALAAQNQLDINRQSLELITGLISAKSLSTLNSSILLAAPQPNNSQYWMEQAMLNNSLVLSAKANLAIIAANRKKVAAADSASVTASGSYSITQSEQSVYDNKTSNDINLAITLNVPLYTGGLNSALLAEQEANYQSAKNTVLLQKRIAAQQARTLFLTIVSGVSQIKALKQASNSSQTAFEATNAGFEVGTRTSVEVLTSINGIYRSKRDESSARYDYLLNLLKLKRAIGQLTLNDITLTNEYIKN